LDKYLQPFKQKNMKTTQMETGFSFIFKKILFASFIGLLFLQFTSCESEKDDDKAHLTIRMTDAPANYDAVLIDVKSIEITGDGGTAVLLNTNSGVYNLLDFSNGLDTMIASGDLEAGSVSQIRLILGPNNAVVVDGVAYPLSTPSAEQSGLKLQVNQTFEAGIAYIILLDFDASQSVSLTGNGTYKLKPVIRTINTAITGSIKGSISPIGENVVVTATSNGVSYSSVTNANGAFQISGLPAGTYSITVIPVLPLLPVTISEKTVVVGASTDLGITILL
jgi:hypothetical protein